MIGNWVEFKFDPVDVKQGSTMSLHLTNGKLYVKVSEEKEKTAKGFNMAPTTNANIENPFTVGRREWYAAQWFRQGLNREQAIIKALESVSKQIKPWVYSQNPPKINAGMGYSREPKPLLNQYRLAIHTVNVALNKLIEQGFKLDEPYHEKEKFAGKSAYNARRRLKFIHELIDAGKIADPNTSQINEPGATWHPSGVKILSAHTSGVAIDPFGVAAVNEPLTSDPGNYSVVTSYEPEPIPEPGSVSPVDPQGEPLISNSNSNSKVEPKPQVNTKPASLADEIEQYYALLMLARAFVMERELSGEVLDIISTRAVKDGCKAIFHGLHVDEVFHAVVKTWPEDSLNELKRWNKPWVPKSNSSIKVDRYENPLPGSHRYLGYVMVLAEARVPVFLVGPSGSGKSFMARDLCEAYSIKHNKPDFSYGELPLTAGATPSWLSGAYNMDGYKSRPFVDIYKSGGVFCFEEIDAADPNMLLLVNNALANESFSNPVTGKEVRKHDDFIPVATANTYGLGANRQYTGRERLDLATLDRWRIGRVEVDYDQNVERNIVDFWKRKADDKNKPKPVKAVKKNAS